MFLNNGILGALEDVCADVHVTSVTMCNKVPTSALYAAKHRARSSGLTNCFLLLYFFKVCMFCLAVFV